MKLFNTHSELRALKTICDGDQKYGGRLLALLSDDHFYYEPAKAAIHRIRVLVKSTGNMPSYSDLCADPTIDEDYRKLLVKSKESSIKSSSLMQGLLDTLNKYHKLRSLYFMSESMFNKLQKEKVDIESALEDVTNTVTQLRVKSDISQSIYHTGINNNSTSLVKNLLSKCKPNYVPTGFSAFDTRNGGIMYGSLFVIGGSTGGGKSTLALNLLKNMSLAGEDVAYVPLEMTSEESMARLISTLSQVPLIKIIKKQLTDNERKKIISSYKQYIDKLKKLECRYTIFSPEEDMTAEDILMILKPYGYRVIIIDYIGLLKGVDGDDSWQQLGKVARFCKIWAKNNNMVVVLLAQVSEEGKIRYARSIAEHCVTGDTLIDTDKGLIRIDSLYPDAKIMSTRNVDVKVKSDGGYLPISGVHYNGIRQVYKITLEDGHTIKCTANHRIRTLNIDGNIGWSSISKSLKEGNWVAVDTSKSSFSSRTSVYEVPAINIHHNAKPKNSARFSRILSIEKLGEEKVYDLTVPETHNYVANGIVVHNSNSAWVFVATEETRESGLLDIKQVKSRNQEMFPFQLSFDGATMTIKDVDSSEQTDTDDSDEPDYLKDVSEDNSE